MTQEECYNLMNGLVEKWVEEHPKSDFPEEVDKMFFLVGAGVRDLFWTPPYEPGMHIFTFRSSYGEFPIIPTRRIGHDQFVLVMKV